MLPILFDIGPVTVYSFGLMLALGILFGVYYVWSHGRVASLPEEKLLDAAIITILAGLVGARLLYVLSNLSLYSDDPLSALAFWNGGLSFWGALIGGALAVRIVAGRFHWPAGSLYDLAAPGVALGSAFGYLGALLNGSAYGGETSFMWGLRLQGLTGLRHPSQVLEALLQLGLFLLLLRLRKRTPFAGFLALVYLLLYSIGRFLLEFLRGDQTHLAGPFSQAHLTALLVGMISLALIYLRLARLQGSWRVDLSQVLRSVDVRGT